MERIGFNGRIMGRIIFFILFIFSFYRSGATTYNIAPKAYLSASSSLDGFPVTGIVDGFSRIVDTKEWRSVSTQTFWGQIDYPSVELKWDMPHLVNKVIHEGKEFIIRTEYNSARNYKIQDCLLNGKPLDKCILRHADFAKGGVLDLKLGR